MEGGEEGGGAGGRGLQVRVLGGMEAWFLGFGTTVASRPLATILLCFLATALCGVGLLRFRAENEGIKLWIPEDSDFRLNNDWLFEKFPRSARFGSLVLVAEDVLVPEVVQAMYRLSRQVAAITNLNNDTWESMCARRPVVRPPSLFGRRRRRRAEDGWEEEWGAGLEEEWDEGWEDDAPGTGWDPSVSLYPEPYCTLASSMDTACLELSILELWGEEGEYGGTTDEEIATLTKDKILNMINSNSKSGIFLTETNFSQHPSGVTYDSAGRILGATATTMRWIGRMNMTSSKLTPAEGRGEPIDPRTLEWEGNVLDVLLNASLYPPGLQFAPNMARSFGDIAGSTILGDLGLFGGGYVMMFLYASLMLGKVSAAPAATHSKAQFR